MKRQFRYRITTDIDKVGKWETKKNAIKTYWKAKDLGLNPKAERELIGITRSKYSKLESILTQTLNKLASKGY